MTEQEKKKNYKPMYTGPLAALSAAHHAKQRGDDAARKAAIREFGWWCGRVPK